MINFNHFTKNEPLKNHTTLKIGGPAKYFFVAKTIKELTESIKYARIHKIPFLLIGNGSNVLISNLGFNGLVIKNVTSKVKLLGNNQVRLDSGVLLPKAIFSLLDKGLTGLETFVGIPASIGGATFMNIHGQGKFWADFFVSATLFTPENQIKTALKSYFKFGYDSSIIMQSKEIVLTTTLKLESGSKEKSLKLIKKHQRLKSHHPQISAGCVFQNLTLAQQKKLKLPTPSIGYLMDKVLKLKGTQIGQARISPHHAGFIENLGDASSQDVLDIIKLMKKSAKEKLDLPLKLEIEIYG
jgi:UDP-N-acetylmuramate dehydrogenase